MVTRKKALDAHMICCPYRTSQIGENINPVTKVKAKCGAGHLYCTGDCFYVQTFLKELDEE